MRIGIIGVGSIGSLFAGRLASTSCDLLLYGRGLHAAHLTVEGLTISGIEESSISSHQWEILLEEQTLPESVESSCDVVLMTGKTTAFDQHLVVAKYLLRNDGIVCSLANGLGHEERLVQTFGANRVLAATTTHGAFRPEPGHVRWAGLGQVTLGPFMHHHSEQSVDGLIQLLAKAGLQPQWEMDGRVLLWNKMLLNIAINPIAGLLGKENGALLEPTLFESAVSVMLEGAMIARAEGVRLADDDVLIDQLRTVLEATRGNRCSMLQDIRSGRETEINALNGEISRRGEMLGLQTPLNQALASIIVHLR
ncbi:MAG: 2-dehydropantoate 2-reductase [Candidatus Poseidoniaceae archaeon]|nr:MAG: 2-dehydropantoate 2-reductase [Candidatus Poseidoniaceae archaeon]